MSKAYILQHAAFEGPGRIVSVFRDFGIPIEIRRLYQGDEVPTDLETIRVLVSMGGPMSVADIGSEQHPYLAREVELLQRLIRADRPVLGICLGAQLLAHAAGAKVHPNVKPGATPEAVGTPAPEIGWGPITLPFPGGTEPIMQGIMDGVPMFHWHFDTFELPRLPAPPNAPPPPAPQPPTGNALLASTRTCKNQAYRFKNHLFGFQFHFEMTREGIDAMVEQGKETIVQTLGPDGIERIREETALHYARHERLGDRILRNFVQYLKVY
jgi:GMP synthase-like glutamine amidotransferase